MESNEPRKPRRLRRTALGILALGAAFLGWMFRDCGLGLGSGGLGGWGIGPDEQTARELLAPTNATDAGPASQAPPQAASDATTSPPPEAPPDAPIDAPPGPCQLFLNSAGLTLHGAPATIEEAVRACRAPGKAHLSATGGARAGTYDELIRALEQAGIEVKLDE